MKIQGIYKIVNRVNNKIYIGQSVNINIRFYHHKHNAIIKNIKHPLYDSIRCYGIDNFEFIIIEEAEDVNLLDQREQFWMDYYKSYDRNYGYNVSPTAGGSNRGFEHSEETRQLLSVLGKGKKAWNKGIPHTEESRNKMSKSHKGNTSRKGKKASEKTAKLISESHKGKSSGMKGKTGYTAWNKGKKMSEEFCNKVSKGHVGKSSGMKGKPAWNKGIPCSEEQKRAVSNANKGKVHTEEAILNMSKAQKGRKHNEETKLKMSESAKLRHKNKKLQELKVLTLLKEGEISNIAKNEAINE